MKKIVSMVLLGAVLVSSTGCNMIVEEVVDTVVEKTMGENTITMIQGNLDAVYKGIVSDEYLELLTEGTKDAMSIAGFGFNACCTFGINISEDQIANILKLGINKIYIAMSCGIN